MSLFYSCNCAVQRLLTSLWYSCIDQPFVTTSNSPLNDSYVMYYIFLLAEFDCSIHCYNFSNDTLNRPMLLDFLGGSRFWAIILPSSFHCKFLIFCFTCVLLVFFYMTSIYVISFIWWLVLRCNFVTLGIMHC